MACGHAALSEYAYADVKLLAALILHIALAKVYALLTMACTDMVLDKGSPSIGPDSSCAPDGRPANEICECMRSITVYWIHMTHNIVSISIHSF